MKRAHIPKEPMGKVIVKIKLTNHADVILNRAGVRKAKPRQAEVEALVDTGATRLYLKPSVIKKLGLHEVRKVISRTANGNVERGEYDEVNLELMGRSATLQVIEVPEDVPNLVGQVPLELLDFVVDPRGQRLLGNPEHDGIQMTEVF
jgi:clan AA aspartic protease